MTDLNQGKSTVRYAVIEFKNVNDAFVRTQGIFDTVEEAYNFCNLACSPLLTPPFDIENNYLKIQEIED